MLFKARRFVEYFPPFALIFSAFAWAPLFDVESQPAASASKFFSGLQGRLPIILLTVFVSIGIIKTIPATQESIIGSKSYTLYQGASDWLVRNTPAGELVFQTDWDDFQRLFFYNTHNTYLAGLDPTYLQLYDRDLYDVWVEITRGEVEQPSQVIFERFSARYVHTDLKHGNFLRKAANDPGMVEVYRDGQSVIYEILKP
jgi:hypothetical protein